MEMIDIKSKINIKLNYLIFIELLLKVLNIISAGIFYPFFLYLRYLFVYSKTIISDHKLFFKGNILSFYFKYLIWYICTLFTLGLYHYFLEFKLYKWAIGCTYIENENKESYFAKDELESLLLNIMCIFILIVTFGFSFPIVKCIRYRYRARNTYISGKRLKFIGTSKEIAKLYLRWLIYGILSLGIFFLFVNVLEEKYRIENTVVNEMYEDDQEERESIAIDYVYASTNKTIINIMFIMGAFFIFLSIIYILSDSFIIIIFSNLTLVLILFILYDLLVKYLNKINSQLINKLGFYYLIVLFLLIIICILLYSFNLLINIMILLISYLFTALIIYILMYLFLFKKETIL